MDNLILANFGGPRSLEEIQSFLTALLNDQEVIRSGLPPFMHRWIFNRVARKRAPRIAPDYALIGGKSPIFGDTEAIAEYLRNQCDFNVTTFHRYLPTTHTEFKEKITQYGQKEILVFPLFPQFSYATTGSIARFFFDHLDPQIVNRLRWIKSFSSHPLYLNSFQNVIADTLKENGINEDEVVILFSAHGLPKKFVCTGDSYTWECQSAFEKIAQVFPKAVSVLSYQSQFGKDVWTKPYTKELCADASEWTKGRKKVLVAPLSFTSDHVETLFEIEHQYLPPLKKQGIEAMRIPALNLRMDWLEALPKIIRHSEYCTNSMLLRKPTKKCQKACTERCQNPGC